MSIAPRPTVILALKVRPHGSRYDLLDLAVNGALVEPIGPRTGDIALTIDPELVSPNMSIQVRARGVDRAIALGVYAWSSQLIDDASTPERDERWVTLGQPSGSDVLTVDKTFHPYSSAVLATDGSRADGGTGSSGTVDGRDGGT